MRPSPEVCIDLDTEDLRASARTGDQVEVDDIASVEPLAGSACVSHDVLTTAPGATRSDAPQSDELIEIELTAEEMDAMLDDGREPRRPGTDR